MEYQNAAAPTVTNTINICSGPYATDDNASEDSIANAFVLLSFCSPNSVDFKGRPIKNLFMDENINFTTNCINKFYIAHLHIIHKTIFTK